MTTTYVIPAIFADTAWQQLLSRGAQLIVESVFARTINLRECRENGNLYSIFLKDGYHAPHALSIKNGPVPIVVRQGEIVLVKNKSIELPESTIVSLGCKFQDCHINTGQPLAKNLNQLRSWLHSHTGTSGFPLDNSNGEIGIITKALLDGHRSAYLQQAKRRRPDLTTAASFFIGLGPGLTPSGDDYLIGQLAVAYQTKNLPDIELAITQAVSAHQKKTTPVSQHYLNNAIRGNFSQPIRDLCHATMQNEEEVLITAVQKLLNHGSTSGHDALIGIIDAYDLLNNREKI